MYERMLDQSAVPTIEELRAYCGVRAPIFARLNAWLTENNDTVTEVVFPYGNKYGWGVAHKRKRKLICNVFAERDAFTVMLRLSNAEFDSIYDQVSAYARQSIDRKYPCGDGGWIHFRITSEAHFDDIKTLLKVKCK